MAAAESNGAVKRYTTGGEFLGLIGMAQLQGGCKHVAIAATADTSKVFMLDITNRRLCVLEAKPKQTASKSILKQR